MKRNLRIGKNKKITLKDLILSLLLITAIVFAIIFRDDLNFIDLDLSKEKIYSLTDENKTAISNVTSDINIMYAGSSEKDIIDGIVKEITNINPNISYLDGSEIDEYKKDQMIYIKKNQGVNSKDEKALIATVFVPVEGKYVKNSEQEVIYLLEDKIVDSILEIDSTETRKSLGVATKMQGEAETREFADFLSKVSLKGKKLEFIDIDKEIPEEIETIILIAPLEDISDQAYNNLIRYAKKGGNFFVVYAKLNKGEYLKNFENLLKNYGVETIKEYAVELQNGYRVQTLREDEKTGEKIQVNDNRIVSPRYSGKHEITKNLKDTKQNPIFVLPSPIKILSEEELEKQENRIPNAQYEIQVAELVKTTENATSIKNFTPDLWFKDNIETDKTETKILGTATQIKFDNTEENENLDEKQKLPENATSKMVYFSNLSIISGEGMFSEDVFEGQPIMQVVGNQRLIYESFDYLNNNKEKNIKKGNPLFVEQVDLDYEKKVKLDNFIYIILLILFIFSIVIIYIQMRRKDKKLNDEKEKKIMEEYMEKLNKDKRDGKERRKGERRLVDLKMPEDLNLRTGEDRRKGERREERRKGDRRYIDLELPEELDLRTGKDRRQNKDK